MEMVFDCHNYSNIKKVNDANLMITWSCNSHTMTPIPVKPSKSGLSCVTQITCT